MYVQTAFPPSRSGPEGEEPGWPVSAFMTRWLGGYGERGACGDLSAGGPHVTAMRTAVGLIPHEAANRTAAFSLGRAGGEKDMAVCRSAFALSPRVLTSWNQALCAGGLFGLDREAPTRGGEWLCAGGLSGGLRLAAFSFRGRKGGLLRFAFFVWSGGAFP